MLPGYMDILREAGAIPVILPLTDDEADLRQICEMYDGFLFTGGQDVDPELYEQEPIPELGEICRERDMMEMTLLYYALAMDKPVLGICRGLQFINAALGGSLYQDLATERPGKPTHRMEAPYDQEFHKVLIEKDNELYEIVQAEVLGVNSCHHQAVKVLAPGLKVLARSEDGLVEAFKGEDNTFLWAVQWHPEMNYLKDENSVKIVKKFVESAR